ncbi:MAG TPA: hypothetical protein PK395_14145 [bacterium]|nr:hypothetical protein [bacterium]
MNRIRGIGVFSVKSVIQSRGREFICSVSPCLTMTELSQEEPPGVRKGPRRGDLRLSPGS